MGFYGIGHSTIGSPSSHGVAPAWSQGQPPCLASSSLPPNPAAKAACLPRMRLGGQKLRTTGCVSSLAAILAGVNRVIKSFTKLSGGGCGCGSEQAGSMPKPLGLHLVHSPHFLPTRLSGGEGELILVPEGLGHLLLLLAVGTWTSNLTSLS